MRNIFRGQVFTDGPYTYRIISSMVYNEHTLTIILEEEMGTVSGDLLIYVINRIIEARKHAEETGQEFPDKIGIGKIIFDESDLGDIRKNIYGEEGQRFLNNARDLKTLYQFATENKGESYDITKLKQTLQIRMTKANKTISFLKTMDLVVPNTDASIRIIHTKVGGAIKKARYDNVVVPALDIYIGFNVEPNRDLAYQASVYLQKEFIENCPIEMHDYDRIQAQLR